MPEIELTPKERQALKARAHGLKPVVLVGNSGLSTPVMKEIDRALAAHELIKVKVPAEDRDERDSVFADIAEGLSAARVQAIGKLLVLYRPAPEERDDASEVAQGAGTSDRSPERSQAAGETLGTEADDCGPTRGRACQPGHGSAPRPGRRNPSRRKAQRGPGPRRAYRLKREWPWPIRRRSRRSRTRACPQARALAPYPLRSCRSARGRWDWKPRRDRT